MTEELRPEQAVRVLRAKVAQLEQRVEQEMALNGPPLRPVTELAADIALIATFLADFMDYVKDGAMVWGPDVADLTARNQERLDKLPYVSFDKYEGDDES